MEIRKPSPYRGLSYLERKEGEKEAFGSNGRVELFEPFASFNPSLYDLVGIVG